MNYELQEIFTLYYGLVSVFVVGGGAGAAGVGVAGGVAGVVSVVFDSLAPFL